MRLRLPRASFGRRPWTLRGRIELTGALQAAALFGLAVVILAWPRPVRPSLSRQLGRRLGALPRALQAAGAEVAQPGLGRSARTPLQIPLRGWRDVAVRTWREFSKDKITTVAGGVTFFGLLAIFPTLAAFVSLYGLFADVNTAREQLSLLSGVLPDEVQRFVGDEMERIASAKHGSLGVAFVLSLILSLWSANGAVKALFVGLNVAYDEQERRGPVRLTLVSLLFTLGAIVFAVAAFAGVLTSPQLLAALDLEREGALLAPLRWPALLVMLTLGLSIIYRYGPCRRRPQWSWISIGGAAAAVLWLAASLLFSWYLGNFAHYDRTYGSLGAVIGFMVWLWYTIIIVLLGAELNAELEHQTAIDTTSGPAKPMGARGAKMADTLGRRA